MSSKICSLLVWVHALPRLCCRRAVFGSNGEEGKADAITNDDTKGGSVFVVLQALMKQPAPEMAMEGLG
jgi:hypothetical protein